MKISTARFLICLAFFVGAISEFFIHHTIHYIQFREWEKSQKELNIVTVNWEKLYCLKEVYE